LKKLNRSHLQDLAELKGKVLERRKKLKNRIRKSGLAEEPEQLPEHVAGKLQAHETVRQLFLKGLDCRDLLSLTFNRRLSERRNMPTEEFLHLYPCFEKEE